MIKLFYLFYSLDFTYIVVWKPVDYTPYNTPFSIADNFKPPKRELEKPFRFCVSDVYKGKKVN